MESGNSGHQRKKLLIFAHYYAPDTASTGQILQDLAEGLNREFDVTVICVVPSYSGKIEEKYRSQRFYDEELNGVRLIRVRVPEFSKENKWSRVKNIVSYYFGAKRAAGIAGSQDYVFTISQPPILGGHLGVIAKKNLKAKLIYCIQDFNPEQIMAVNYIKNKAILRLLMKIDKNSCRKSDLVITVGRDLAQTLTNRFRGETAPKYTIINNWIDEKQVFPLPPDQQQVLQFRRKYGLDGKFVVMYSGNLGLYYDLENLIRVLKKFRKGYTIRREYQEGPVTPDGREVVFAFVGDGSMSDTLQQYAARHHFQNIVFIPYQKKEDLIYSLNAADVHWCINAKGIKGVSCPSKAYGIMAAGKPMIGVLEEGSEIRMLIDEVGCGRCCEPGNYVEIENILRWYISHSGTDELNQMGMKGRKYLEGHLTKEISIRKYADAIRNI